MATIGDDIKEVLNELGVAFTVYKTSGSSSTGEKLDLETYSDSSTEFIRQFFGHISLPYDTLAVAGDYICLTGLDDSYWLINSIRKLSVEGDIATQEAAIYRCNVVGGIQREVESTENYRPDDSWTNIYTNVRGAFVERPEAVQLKEKDHMEVTKGERYLFISGNYTPMQGDRFTITATEYYKITVIDKRRFDNVQVLTLVEDTRD